MKTSYSALETFQTCPLKYKYQEIDKLKRPKKVEQVFGTLVHASLKYMFEPNPVFPSLEEVLGHYAEGWANAKEKIAFTDERQKEASEQLYFEEGKKMLTSFYKKNSPWNFNPVELEGFFSVDIEDSKKNVHTIRGVIDRIDKDRDSEKYEIIDYKTGRKMPSQEMLEDNLQLSVYTLALLKRWPHLEPSSIKNSLYFLKHNEKVSASVTQEKIERASRRIVTIIEEIEKRRVSGEFHPTPGPLCDYCEFRPLCPMWSHEYESKEKLPPSDKEALDALKEFFSLSRDADKIKKRLASLKETIRDYMDSKKILRVFDSEGYVTKSITERTSYDIEAIEPILRDAGVLPSLVSLDEKKLDVFLETATFELREQILKHKKIKESVMLKATKKKGASEDEED